MKINVLLVDDQEFVRRGLRMSLSLEGDIHIVGEASEGLEAIDLAQKLNPDVIVMDVEMPRMDGITATQIIRARLPETAVVVLSLHDHAEAQRQVKNAGAFAFIPKQAPLEALVFAIRQAHIHKEKPE